MSAGKYINRYINGLYKIDGSGALLALSRVRYSRAISSPRPHSDAAAVVASLIMLSLEYFDSLVKFIAIM